MIDWIYGKHAVLETLKSGRPVEKILLAKNINKFSVNEIIEHAKNQNVPFQWVPRTRLDQLAEGNNHPLCHSE